MTWKWIQVTKRPLRASVPSSFRPPTTFARGGFPALITIEGNICSKPQWCHNSDPQLRPGSATLDLSQLEGTSSVILNRINTTSFDEEIPPHDQHRVERPIVDMEPSSFLRATSYMVSDIILIQDATIPEVVDKYFHWMRSCQISLERNLEFPDRRSKPYAVISASQTFETGDIKSYVLNRYCEAYSVDSKVYYDLQTRLFADLVLVAEDGEFDTVLASAAARSLRSRDENHHLWSTSEFFSLLEHTVQVFSGIGSTTFNRVRALTSGNELQVARDTLWPDMIRNGYLHGFSEKFLVKTFSRCLSRYAAKCAHGTSNSCMLVEIPLIHRSVPR